jgi:hypothetical protein
MSRKSNTYFQKPSKIRPDEKDAFDYLIGLDFGIQHTGVVFKASIDDPTGNGFLTPNEIRQDNCNLTAVACLVKEETNTQDYIATVLNMTFTPEQRHRVVIVCDPAGNNRNVTTGEVSIGLLRKAGYRAYAANFAGIQTDGTHRRQFGLDSVRSRIQMNRFFVLKSQKNLIDAIVRMKSDNRTLKEVGRDPASHWCDAVRYLISWLFPFTDLFKNEAAYKAYADQKYYKGNQ